MSERERERERERETDRERFRNINRGCLRSIWAVETQNIKLTSHRGRPGSCLTQNRRASPYVFL